MSSQLQNLYKVTKHDLQKASMIMIDAFQDDPVWNAIFEGVPNLDQKIGAFFETPLRHCLKFGQVYATSDKLEGVAAWVPGRYADMTFWRMLRSGGFVTGLKMGIEIARKMQPALEPIERDRKEFMQDRSFIYLQIIGVATAYQGQGFGGKLINALVELSEESRLPIYLETETERNVRMYERYGFKLIKEITLPVIHVPMWQMVREPSIAL
jgi:ribosomal protein S18 acetylase RimI-like enzyme